MSFSKKTVSIIITLLSIVGYGFVVFAAPPSSGGYAPAETLDPECNPGESIANSDPYDCFVTPPSGGSGWALAGNSGTTPGTDFIGTTDAQDFMIKTDGAQIGLFGQLGNVALGSNATANGTYGMALGRFAEANAFGSIAFYGGVADGELSVAFFDNAHADESFAFRADAYGNKSIALGAPAYSYGELAVGLGPTSYTATSTTAWSALDRLFVVGNSAGPLSDAFMILKNGNAAFGVDNWEADSDASSIALKIAGRVKSVLSEEVASSTTRNLSSFESTLTAVANTTSVSYSSLGTSLVWDGGAFNATTSAGAAGLSALYGSISTSATSSGALGSLQGVIALANHAGTGSIDSLFGGKFTSAATGTGTVVTLGGLDGSATITNASAVVNTAYGVTGSVTNRSTGATIGTGFGADFRVVVQSGGIVQSSQVLNLTSFVRNTGSITSANAINISGGSQGTSYQPGIEATLTAKGLNLTSANNLGTDYPALTALNVYGIYMGDKSLAATGGGEYGLYIDDAEAENYFKNGIMVGASPTGDNKISDTTSSTGSGTLYIGTNTIDTTAPSDERTKTNIANTTYGINTLKDIRVVDFIYDQSIISDNSKQHTGVLAQQVQSLYPEAVGHRSDGYMMVDYKTFIPLLIKSTQDLNLSLESIQSISGTINQSFLQKLALWLGDSTNGIEKIYAKVFHGDEVNVKKICLSDDNGSKTCITKSQLDVILGSSGTFAAPDPQTPPSVVTPEDPTPETPTVIDPAPEPTPDPVIEQESDPVTEPVLEPVVTEAPTE